MPIPLETLDDADKPVKRRIKDAKSAYSIFEQFHAADADASYNRAIVRRWTNGEAPFDPADLEDAGLGWVSNFNSLRASADCEQAISNFVNLADSAPHICTFTTKYGKEEDREKWCDIMSEEFDWLMRKRWPSYHDNQQKIADAYIKDGLAVVYWPDDKDFRYEVGRLGQFLFATDADVDESKQDVILFVEDYSFRQLVELLDKDKKVRASEDRSNINREAVIEAIKDAAKDSDIVRLNAEEIVAKIEENPFYYDYAKNQKIKLVHYFVQEASGKVTHSIGRADGKNKEYLSDRYEAYSCMQDVFVFYADGIGSWKLASLLGMIRKALPLYMASDEILNKVKDATLLNLMRFLQSKTSAGKELLSQITLGSLSILPPEIEFVTVPASADTGGQAMPLYSLLNGLSANNTGGYQQHAVSPEGGDRTATEVATQAAATAQLSSAKLGNFYQSKGKELQNMVNRLKDKNLCSADRGFSLVMEWRDRVHKRDVPMEAIWEIDQAEPMTAIGYGSFQQQQAAFAGLQALVPYMDQVGQANLAKDKAASLPGVGYSKLKRYFTDETPRTPDGTREALNEHDTFRSGIPRPVFEDDPHFVHLPIHFTLIGDTIDALHKDAIDVPTALKTMGPTMDHVNQHLQFASKDPSKQAVLKGMHKQFGQFAAVFQKLQEQAQQQQAPQGQQAPDPKLALQAQKDQAEIQRQDALARAEIAREDAKTQAHIQSSAAKTAAHVQTAAQKAANNVFVTPDMQPPQLQNIP